MGAKPEVGRLAELKQLLANGSKAMSTLVPEYLTAERMCRLAVITAGNKTPALLDCDLLSVVNAVMEACNMGLEIGREAHLVPFKGKCILIPDYRGIVNNAVRAGVVKYADSRVVHAGDLFKVVLGSAEPQIIHEPDVTAARNDATITHVYAVARLPDGSPKFDWMSREEVDKVRASSRAANDGPWVTWYGEQAKKTVVKRTFKLVPITRDTPEVRRMIATIEHDNRTEGADVQVITDGDTSESLARQAQERTADRQRELAGKLAATSSVTPPASVTDAAERKLDADLAREGK